MTPANEPLTHAERAALMELARRKRARPWRYVDPLPGQLRFAQSTARQKQFRAGNQRGKTLAGCIEAIARCLGEHPWLPGWRYRLPPPVRGLVVCGTHAQSMVVQRKLWELLSHEDLAPDCIFDERKGAFIGKYPRVRFRNGSEIVIASGKGDTVSIAGGTYDFVWFDEPPESPRVFTEGNRRLTRTGGDLFLTYTPVNNPVGYLRDMAEAGLIDDCHDPMVPESFVHCFSGRVATLPDGTPLDAAWIAEQRRVVPEYEQPVVLDGEYEFRSVNRLFGAFQDHPNGHIGSDAPPDEAEAWVGIDHGTGVGGNACAVLVAVLACPLGPRVWVLDEYVSPGATSSAQDAAGIFAMVERNVGKWSNLTGVWGDIPSSSSSDITRKSNAKLMAEIGILAGQPNKLTPPIWTVKGKRGGHARGSVHLGLRFLTDRMTTAGMLRIHPRCQAVRDGLNKWDGTKKTEAYKHILDALRYSLADAIMAYHRTRSSGPTMTINVR